ncbi:hypothetical protein DGMP_29200 [Desulfomarina profundi]|uniref:Fibronectin type-III domain-containing protein n=1 Tax=Desulfomarina profundi TaxID=2772557 RepID=A0A8D5JN24_9BACT|nr:autotransporter domain-containing protein [Desulfomarina profundi]BCL62227.1 hypothetical protein DGMP_29200 [Desulfomarina profundi]
MNISGFSYRFAPNNPTGVNAVAGNTQATVSWTAPADIGDGPITSYDVTASPGGATCSTSGTSCTVTGLTNGTDYTFNVTATNAYGTGPASSESAAVTPNAQSETTDSTQPGQSSTTAPRPTVLSVRPESGSFAGGTKIVITGKAFSGATKVTIGGVAATNFSVANSTTITATTPANTPGVKNISVTTGSGTGTGTGLFTYLDLSNPADDPANVSLVSAQAELSRQFIKNSLLPVMDRMEQMHSRKANAGSPQQQFELNLAGSKYGQIFNLLPVSTWLNEVTGNVLPNSYAIWIQGMVSDGSTDGSSTSTGRDTDGYGVTIGIDKRLDETKLVGTSLFIGQNDSNIHDGGSGVDMDALSLSLYGSYALTESTFLDGVIGIGRQNYELIRIKNGSILSGERTGSQVFGSIALSKNMEIQTVITSTYLRGDFGYTVLSDYTESGSTSASAPELVYDDLNVSLAIISAGLKVERPVEIKTVLFKPYARIEYGTDISSSDSASMFYASAPGTTYQISIDDDSSSIGRFGLGLDLITDTGFTVGIDYERQQYGSSNHLDTYRIDGAYKMSPATAYNVQLSSNYGAKPILTNEIQLTVNPHLMLSTGSTLDLESQFNRGLVVFVNLTFQ